MAACIPCKIDGLGTRELVLLIKGEFLAHLFILEGELLGVKVVIQASYQNDPHHILQVGNFLNIFSFPIPLNVMLHNDPIFETAEHSIIQNVSQQ